MRKLVYILFGLMTTALLPMSCRLAPSNNPGDTVAASVFEPPVKKTIPDSVKWLDSIAAADPDSTDIFYIGEGSNRRQLVLLSYPSRRDTTVARRGRHLRVKGNADFGRVVRVRLLKDNLAVSVESIDSLNVK